MALITDSSLHKIDNIVKEIVNKLDYTLFKKNRWFQSKTEEILTIKIKDYGILSENKSELIIFLLLKLYFKQGEEDIYYFPLFLSENKLKRKDYLLKLNSANFKFFVYEGIHMLKYNQALINLIKQGKDFILEKGGLIVVKTLSQSNIYQASPLTEFSSNSITLLKKRQVLKSYRKLNKGLNVELELGLNLLKSTSFRNFPCIESFLLYQDVHGSKYSLCILEEYIANQGDMWSYTLDYLCNYIEYTKGRREREELLNYIFPYCQESKNLGKMIAKLHLALSNINKDSFLPYKASDKDIEFWYQGITNNVKKLFKFLKRDHHKLKDKYIIKKLYKIQAEIAQVCQNIFLYKDDLGLYMRVHGDLHLGQILKKGQEHYILDFEGEPLNEYKGRKYSPLKDLSGILRSFNYARYAAFFNFKEKKEKLIDEKKIVTALKLWEKEVVNSFLTAYFEEIKEGKKLELLPSQGNFLNILNLFKLEKVFYEAIYEINNRPKWLIIPLEGIIECVQNKG